MVRAKQERGRRKNVLANKVVLTTIAMSLVLLVATAAALITPRRTELHAVACVVLEGNIAEE